MANEYTTLPGQLAESGLNSLVDLANKYKDNPEIAGLVTGSLADAYKTQVNTAQSLQYNDAYLGSLAKYQQGLEDLRKGNTMELMGQESAITERLQGQQISGQKDLANIQADTTRYGYDRDLQGIQAQIEGSKYVADKDADVKRYASDQDLKGVEAQAGATKYAAGEQAGAVRFGAEKEYEGVKEQAGATRFAASEQAGASKFGSEKELEGVKEQAGASRFAADIQSARQLEGQKYGYDSQEKQIGLTGREERENIKTKYAQERESQLALRADARGAIARAGARFYG